MGEEKSDSGKGGTKTVQSPKRGEPAASHVPETPLLNLASKVFGLEYQESIPICTPIRSTLTTPDKIEAAKKELSECDRRRAELERMIHEKFPDYKLDASAPISFVIDTARIFSRELNALIMECDMLKSRRDHLSNELFLAMVEQRADHERRAALEEATASMLAAAVTPVHTAAAQQGDEHYGLDTVYAKQRQQEKGIFAPKGPGDAAAVGAAEVAPDLKFKRGLLRTGLSRTERDEKLDELKRQIMGADDTLAPAEALGIAQIIQLVSAAVTFISDNAHETKPQPKGLATEQEQLLQKKKSRKHLGITGVTLVLTTAGIMCPVTLPVTAALSIAVALYDIEDKHGFQELGKKTKEAFGDLASAVKKQFGGRVPPDVKVHLATISTDRGNYVAMPTHKGLKIFKLGEKGLAEIDTADVKVMDAVVDMMGMSSQQAADMLRAYG